MHRVLKDFKIDGKKHKAGTIITLTLYAGIKHEKKGDIELIKSGSEQMELMTREVETKKEDDKKSSDKK